MPNVFIGIDPGVSGASAMLFPDGEIEIHDFDTGNGVIAVLQDNWIWSYSALIERVSAMPKQGVVSMFKLGTNFGQWIGRLEALGIPYGFVAPRKWQQEMYGSTPKVYKTVKGKKVLDTKAMSLTVARATFPKMGGFLNRKKDHNRADALLLAEYCKRLNKGAAQ